MTAIGHEMGNLVHVPRPDFLPPLLLVDSAEEARQYHASLEGRFQLSRLESPEVAVEFLRRTVQPPAFVVTELGAVGRAGYDVCLLAKAFREPSTVLVMTAVPERVPEALAAGCDAVLLKPFPPNLLSARLGRLHRARAAQLQARAALALAKSHELGQQTAQLFGRAIEERPFDRCPHCSHQGITSFEYASHRRSWCACPACRKVWVARLSR